MKFALHESRVNLHAPFDVSVVVKTLWDLGKISSNTLNVWSDMVANTVPIEGYVEHGQFYYSILEKVINHEILIQDEETTVIFLIHRLLNDELTKMEVAKEDEECTKRSFT